MRCWEKLKSSRRNIKGDDLTFTLTGPSGDTAFQGKLAKDGPDAGKYPREFPIPGSIYFAAQPGEDNRCEGGTAQAEIRSSRRFRAAASETDPKSRIKKIEELIQDNHGRPNNQLLYGELLATAEAAGLDGKKVGDLIKQWSDEAKPYGDAWLNEVRFKALKAIGTSKSFAKLGVELAQEVDKAVSEEAVEKKAMVVGLLAAAARHAGMEDLAKEADARHAKLEDPAR